MWKRLNFRGPWFGFKRWGDELALIIPRWTIVRDRWGVYASRRPWPWSRFGVPGNMNKRYRLVRF